MRMLEKIIKENEQFVTDDGETPRFICHPEGVVHISVPAEKWHLLRQRQYKIARVYQAVVQGGQDQGRASGVYFQQSAARGAQVRQER